MKIYNRIYVLLFTAVLLSLTSCKLTRPVERTSAIKAPLNFPGQTDSTGVGALNRDMFFKDKSLIALIDTALQNNLDLKMAIQRIEMARSNIMISQGALLPSVNAEVSAGGRKFGDYTMDGVGNYDTNFSGNINDDRRIPGPVLPDYFVGLRSSWEVDIWGKLKTQRKGAYSRFLASEKARQAITTSLVAQVAGYYYELIKLDTELNIIKKNSGGFLLMDC